MKFSVLALTPLIWGSCEAHTRRQSFPIGGLVNTTSGTVQGTASKLRPDVSAYLGIPYAQPPIGPLRFAAPVPVNGSSSVIQATSFSPDCAANLVPDSEAFLGGPAGQKITTALAQAGDTQSEDCLTVNVWTKPQTGEAAKAVLFWIYGGGFSIGNTANPIYDGSILADENDVVVVSVNYRLNIFGFSGAPGQTPNVGLWDQRIALEWVRSNIAAFGGDPSRITAFGQSAGGASVDYIAFAPKFINDPIAHALIPQSGNAAVSFGESSVAAVTKNWYNASAALGCGGATQGAATVDCVRTKSTQEILNAILPLQETALASGFAPIADDVLVPADPTAQGNAGNFSKLPILTGNTDNEASFFVVLEVAYTNLTQAQFNSVKGELALIQPLLDAGTLVAFTCPTSQTANFRAKHGVPVWRYRYYGGNYTNTYISGAGSDYHTSELPIVFGTASEVTGVPDTPAEEQAGPYIRNVWSTFARTGSLASLGWPQYNANTNSLARLAYGNETTASFIPNLSTDATCSTVESVTTILGELAAALAKLGL